MFITRDLGELVTKSNGEALSEIIVVQSIRISALASKESPSILKIEYKVFRFERGIL